MRGCTGEYIVHVNEKVGARRGLHGIGMVCVILSQMRQKKAHKVYT